MLLVPAYFHPAVAPGDWAALAGAGAVVLNIDSGPGTSMLPEFAEVCQAITASLLGYVDLAYGRRPADAVRDEAERYREWYGTDGVFLDQAPSDAGRLAGHRALTASLSGMIVCNHGTYPEPGYAELADVLVTFEGPWQAYRDLRAPGWALRLPAGRFCHLVYDVPPSALAEVQRHAARCHAGSLYATDRAGANPYDRLPSYRGRLSG